MAKREKGTGYRITDQSWRELRLASTRNRYESGPQIGLGCRWRGHKVRLACTNNASISSMLMPCHCQPSAIDHHPSYSALGLPRTDRAPLHLAERHLRQHIIDPLREADPRVVPKGPSSKTSSLHSILHSPIRPTFNIS